MMKSSSYWTILIRRNVNAEQSKLIARVVISGLRLIKEGDVVLTVEQCAQQFELYAESNPSSDSQHSLRFCAKFLREFCHPSKSPSLITSLCEALNKIYMNTKECEIRDMAVDALALSRTSEAKNE